VDTLREFGETYLAGIEATQDPNAPLREGDHCQYCPAAAICEAKQEGVSKHALEVFKDRSVRVRLPDPTDPDQIARALEARDRVLEWATAVGEIAERQATLGVPIPGHKLVRSIKNRTWKSEVGVKAALAEENIGDSVVYSDPKLKSPAQLEKVMGKAWVDQFTERKQGGLTLVPDSDRRPAEQPEYEQVFQIRDGE